MNKLFIKINSISRSRLIWLFAFLLFLLGVAFTCDNYFKKQELTASIQNAKLKTEEQRQQDITYKTYCELTRLSEEIGKFYNYSQEGLIPNLIDSQIIFEEIKGNLRESYRERPSAEIGEVINVAEFFERFCEQKAEGYLRIFENEGNHAVDLLRLKRNNAKAVKLLNEFNSVSIKYYRETKNILSQPQKNNLSNYIESTFKKDVDKYFSQLNNLGDPSKVLMYPQEWPHISMYLLINDLM